MDFIKKINKEFDDIIMSRLLEVLLRYNNDFSTLNSDFMSKLMSSSLSGNLVFANLKRVAEMRLERYYDFRYKDTDKNTNSNTDKNIKNNINSKAKELEEMLKYISIAFKRLLHRYRSPKYDLAYVAKHLVVSSLFRFEDVYDDNNLKCPELIYNFFEFCASGESNSNSLGLNIFSALLLARDKLEVFNNVMELIKTLGIQL